MTKNLLSFSEVKPLHQPTDKLVILLHGVGSDCNDLISLVPYIQNSLPNYHFISLNGIEAYDMAPYGRQWFSLQDRSKETITKLVEKNSVMVSELIVELQKELSFSNKNTILLGFSQGTMMSIYLTLAASDPYFATIAFSGRLVAPINIVNDDTPICIIHGKNDDVVDVAEAEIMQNYLTTNNILNDKLLIDNLSHSIDDKGLKFAINFLNKIQNPL